MEDFSENKEPKRGRPRVTPPWTTGLFDRKDTTRRTNVNDYYVHCSISVLFSNSDGHLSDKQEFHWLCHGYRTKRTLLAELRRIEDPDAMIQIARELCKYKPKTRIAAARIRAWRNGHPMPTETIEGSLLRAVNQYIADHPGITYDAVLAGIDATRTTVVAAASKVVPPAGSEDAL